MTDRFIDTEQPITNLILDEVENELAITLPNDFRAHYLTYNGGEPIYRMWNKEPQFEVYLFISIRYRKDFKNDPVFILEGRTKMLWNNTEKDIGFVPQFLLPFALTYRYGYVCLNLEDNKIYTCINELWDMSLSEEENREATMHFVCDSFSDFMNGLEPEEVDENESSFTPTKIVPNDFIECAPSLTPAEMEAFELTYDLKLPLSFKKHYLKFNGGVPLNTLWSDDKWELGVDFFFPIKHSTEHSLNSMEKEIDSLWSNKYFPGKVLLPFAYDGCGCYFCLHLETNKIYYFVMDVWSDYLSDADNLEVNAKLVCASFPEFINGLVENYLDEEYEDEED